jgi:DNA-directed RNA polymerase specialized sigma24 family protein
VRGVVAQIDERLAVLDRELKVAQELMAERRSLLTARREITGEAGPSVLGSMVRRITQDEVTAFLEAHPGVRANEIAKGMNVPLTTISQHLHRGRGIRFDKRPDGWYVISEKPGGRGK